MGVTLKLKDSLVNAIDEVLDKQKELSDKLIVVDAKVCDIEHFIELASNLNAAQGYEAYRLLKEVLIERREVKNELSELQSLVAMFNHTSKFNKSRIKEISNKVDERISFNRNKTDKRHYSVRAMQDIFGETIKKTI